MTEKTFAAFFSYVHADDEHDNGRLSAIRKWLEEEISAQTGEPFEIFQDRNDIYWGHAWEQRINGVLDSSTFLIAVVTPRYLKSEYCRKEFERFIEREKKMRRNDLILPLLYMDTPALSNASDSVAAAISSRQYADWRGLRFEPWVNPDVTKRLSQMSKMICNAITREPPSPRFSKTIDNSVKSTKTQSESHIGKHSAEPEKRKPVTIIEPPTVIVDPMPRRGDYTLISKAIESAEPGTRILIRPGLYGESLVLDKPLEIIGDGARNEIVIEVKEAEVVQFKTEFGRVSNLTLRQTGGSNFFGVNILQGRLELEDCDITSDSLACVAIYNDADPRLRRNRIHDGKTGGIFIYYNGRGTLENNDIFNNAMAGVEIQTGGNPTLRSNRIYNGKTSGVLVWDNGQGILEGNDIFGNAMAGVAIGKNSHPTLRSNRIHGGQSDGVLVYDNGRGTLEDNDIFNNAMAGVTIMTGGNPTLRYNRIHDGQSGGVFVYDNGIGSLEDNDIFNNVLAGVEIKTGGNPTLRHNRVHDGKSVGVFVWNNGRGVLEDNTIYKNAYSGIEIRSGGRPRVQRNKITGNVYHAIWIHDNGGGNFEDNDLRNNIKGAWYIDESSRPNSGGSGNIDE